MSVTLFLAGLTASFILLMGFEAEIRRGWESGKRCAPQRALVGATLRRLIASSAASGVGIGLLGMTAFVWGRAAPSGAWAYVWAALFALAAVAGWTTIVVMAFMVRVNSLENPRRGK